MATALDMIKRSMRLFGAIGQGNEPTAEEAENGLNLLNGMLQAWSIERLLVYHILEETFTWTTGNAYRTIGSGGNFDTARPTRIESGFTRISDVDYTFRVVDKKEYDQIADKSSQSSYPQMIYYDNTMSLGVVYGYPVPSSNISIHLNSWKQLQSFTALTDVVSLPLGYQRAIEYNLSVELQCEYPDLPIPSTVLGLARETKASLKKFNVTPIVSDTGLVAHRRYNIYADS